MKQEILIKKASGDTEIFREDKLIRSLTRSGADKKQITDILSVINDAIYPGVTTQEIYQLAHDLLKSNSHHWAARYSLKRAIMELGPSGFPFEKLIAEIFRHQGYFVQTNRLMAGKCVQHEIDIFAERGDDQMIIECKYHNSQGIITGVKIPLYVHSRFLDVIAILEDKDKKYKAGLVTNTKFSPDALTYAECSEIYMLAWNYPSSRSIKYWIDTAGLYPVTCLTSITREEKKEFLDKNIILCTTLKNNPSLLREIGIQPARHSSILAEIEKLCQVNETRAH